MPPEECLKHDGLSKKLDEMHVDLRAILTRLNAGDVTFATTILRVNNIEKVIYGALGLALTAICGSVLALVLKVHP